VRILKIIILFSILFPQGSIEVSVNKKELYKGESFNLIIKAKNTNEFPDIDLPLLTDFEVIGGPNQSSSSSIRIINGKRENISSTSISWSLLPLKEGEIILPSFPITLDGRTVKSSEFKISVINNHKSGKHLKYFIKSELDNDSPFVGQQVSITYKLYTQIDINSLDLEAPVYKGFWVEDLYEPKAYKFNRENYNGVLYHVAIIKKTALFPTQSGKINIEPLNAVIGIQEKRSDWNNFSFFGPPAKKYNISTQSLELDVKPLPAFNEETSNVVGEWEISSSINSHKVMQDNALTLTLIIKGYGNVKVIDIPKMILPNVIEMFEPKIQINTSKEKNKIYGEKIFEWVIIPRDFGKIEIPSIQFIYFSPKNKRWIIKSTKNLLIDVEKNNKAKIQSIGLFKEEVALVGEDIRFLDDSKPYWIKKDAKIVSNLALFFLFLSLINFSIPRAQHITKDYINKNSRNLKSKRAIKHALKLLNTNEDSAIKIYTMIQTSIYQYINNKMGYNKAEYSVDEIIVIVDKHITEHTRDSLRDMLLKGESIRFSPNSTTDKKTDFKEFKKLLINIDNEWN